VEIASKLKLAGIDDSAVMPAGWQAPSKRLQTALRLWSPDGRTVEGGVAFINPGMPVLSVHR
jgi:hypothetical protein